VLDVVLSLTGRLYYWQTTLLNVLAERTNMGVVTGDRFVNGQQLPPDFQGQTCVCYPNSAQITNLMDLDRFPQRILPTNGHTRFAYHRPRGYLLLGSSPPTGVSTPERKGSIVS
jgi:hypothetical protein